MRQLLAAYSALSAHKHGDTLEVIKGTNVREVSPEYLTAKKELLENGDLNNPASIKASLAAFEEKWRRLLRKRAAKLKVIKGKGVLKSAGTSAYARELTHSLTSCLNALSHSAPADDDASDLEEDLAALVADPTCCTRGFPAGSTLVSISSSRTGIGKANTGDCQLCSWCSFYALLLGCLHTLFWDLRCHLPEGS